MAVSIPSDLVLDVMRNADPARQRQAVAAFDAPSVESPAAFAKVMRRAATEPAMADAGITLPRASAESAGGAAARNFERMVLRSLFEPMLPSPESGAFGTGPSAGIWRALAADEFAGAAAKSGQFGLAAMIEPPKPGLQPRGQSQWPYFETGPITSFAG